MRRRLKRVERVGFLTFEVPKLVDVQVSHPKYVYKKGKKFVQTLDGKLIEVKK